MIADGETPFARRPAAAPRGGASPSGAGPDTEDAMNRRTLIASAAAALGAPTRLRAEDAPIKLRDLYARGRGLAALALRLAGTRIAGEGFMAPPPRAESDFFVMTKMPMAVCPFCETAAEWPDDILAAYTKRTVRVLPFNRKLVARGVLEHGEYLDPATSFVSLLRLVDTSYDLA